MEVMTVYVVPRDCLRLVGCAAGVWCDGRLCGVLTDEDCRAFATSHGPAWGWRDPIPCCAELFKSRWVRGPLLRDEDACSILAGCDAEAFRWGVWEPIEAALLAGFPASIEFI